MNSTNEQLARWRKDTPGCERVTHLNSAGASLMPVSVLETMTGYLQRESLYGGYESEEDAAGEIQQAYGHIATLVATHPRNIAIVENATVAFFQALSSIDFKAGDVIVTTRNDYISNQIAYLSLAKRYGAVIHRAADLPTGGVDLDSVRTLLKDPKVCLLAVTWVPTNSGLIQPVQLLGEIAASANVTYLIDACQAAGQIPINVEQLGCDFLSVTGRKFLRGPRGIGFLYVSDRALKRGDHPLYIDMRGADWTTADTYALRPDARRYENWEFAYSLVLGLGEAARYATSVGIELAGTRANRLAAKIRRRLEGIPRARILDQGKALAAIVTVEMKGWEASQLVALLRQRGINTSATFREYAVIDMDDKGAGSALRISPHYYNTEEEIGRFVDALIEVCRSGT